jgi:hypothetical protein
LTSQSSIKFFCKIFEFKASKKEKEKEAKSQLKKTTRPHNITMKIISALVARTAFLALTGTGGLTSTVVTVDAFDYTPDITVAVQNLVDNVTTIEELRTIFINDVTLVYLEGIEWSLVEGDDSTNSSETETTGGGSTIMKWETSVNGVVQDSGEVDLSDVGRELPTSIEAGSIKVEQSKFTVTVTVTVLYCTVCVRKSNKFQSFTTLGRDGRRSQYCLSLYII